MGMKKERETSTSLFRGSEPQMPEGYYSGDQPNPSLRAFVEQHMKERPYDALHDDYDVAPFAHAIDDTKSTALYRLHTYWSKKKYSDIQQYVRHYTKPGDLVLDPFCGSGSTALAALMEGRGTIAIDRSPAATFITKNYCTPLDPSQLQQALHELETAVRPEVDWLYETRCEKCGGLARTLGTVYSQIFQCPECGERIALFDCPEIAVEKFGKSKKMRVCPFCRDRSKTVEIDARCVISGAVPVSVSYECLSGCTPRRDSRTHNDPDPLKREYFERFDMGKIREIESKEVSHWYPHDKMMNVEDDTVPWGDKWRAGTSNFRSVDELFTRRNLWALATIREHVHPDGLVEFLWTAGLLPGSRLNGVVGGTLAGTYYLPPVFLEGNILESMERRANTLADESTLRLNPQEAVISTQTATDLGAIRSDSIDYVFTDPPYGGKFQYGELNFVWEAWLGLDTHWHEDEIIVNTVRGKTEDDWASLLRQAMEECYRVLKPGRWLSLCYHDTSEGTWSLVQDIMSEIGFVADRPSDVLYLDSRHKSFNQYTAGQVTKRDLVINFRKHRPDEAAAVIHIDGSDAGDTLNDKVRAIITDYLTDHPGTTKDRVWDAVASRMVREGQMQPHDFEALLRDVASEVTEPAKKDHFSDEPPDIFGTHVVNHWYLKSTAYVVEDEAERSKEDEAAAVTHAFIDRFLGDHPEQDGVHYSDLFEYYLTHVTEKPRRRLAEWLPDYFFFTADGTWRLPATADEE